MQVMRLRRRHHFTVVAVAGSVGKTSTKLAIAELLGTGLRVRYQKGNYNDRVTVPLVFFGQTQPALYNIFAWMKVFGENAAALAQPYPYDVVVVEIGTDGPGQMKQFAYLRPDICVLTAITPEHMENFGSLAAVAAEETQIFDYAKQVLVSSDDVPASYVQGETYLRYSLSDRSAENYGRTTKSSLSGQELSMVLPGGNLTAHIRYLGEQGARYALAAAAVAGLLGFDTVAIKQGLSQLEPFAGRMRVFGGIKNTSIIDDTYNASPVAVKAALDVLYAARASQRIAVLGSMNEMGAYAKTAHQEVGEYCDAHKLDYVLTLGADAARWIAPAAKVRGCQVHSFTGADACAAYVRKHLQERAVVLVKGSQNGVFAEEVVKQLLAQPKDAENLVRQSPAWLRKKARQV
jgi:UDP-N-acetylmuramyl pentapeptide synthase